MRQTIRTALICLLLLGPWPAQALTIDLNWGSADIPGAFSVSLGGPVADYEVSEDLDRASWTLDVGQLIILTVDVANPEREYIEYFTASLQYDASRLRYRSGAGAGQTSILEEVAPDGSVRSLTGFMGFVGPIPPNTGLYESILIFGASGEGTTGAGPDEFVGGIVFEVTSVGDGSPLDFRMGLTRNDVVSPGVQVEFDGVTMVPEPSSGTLLALGLGLLAWRSETGRRSGRSRRSARRIAIVVVSLLPGVASAEWSASSVSSGSSHACALTTDGRIYCWGSNRDGELGSESAEPRSTIPVEVADLPSGMRSVSAGGDDLGPFTCAVGPEGGVYFWGDFLAIGDPSSGSTPIAVPELSSGFERVSSGSSHACALSEAGEVFCWGSAYLGDGARSQASRPVRVLGLPEPVRGVSAGGVATCVVTESDQLYCWGDNRFGTVGDGTQIDRPTPTLIAEGIIDVSVGISHACSVDANGGIACWGEAVPDRFEPFEPGVLLRLEPIALPGLSSGYRSVSVGDDDTCAVRVDGGVDCWGGYERRKWGRGRSIDDPAPAAVEGLSGRVVAMDAGVDQNCALVEGGLVQCWGVANLGNGYLSASAVPVAVDGLPMDAGGFEVDGGSCAIGSTGSALCWGGNLLGDGFPGFYPLPVPLAGIIDPVVDLDRAGAGGCAVTAPGDVYCWGKIDELVPTRVVGLTGKGIAVESNGRTFCVVTDSGGVECWGRNEMGELGNPSVDASYSDEPVPFVLAPPDVVGVAMGWSHVCFRTGEGGVWCRGSNGRGELGDGTFVDRDVPVRVLGLDEPIVQLEVGHSHTCALSDDGGIQCWGENLLGQLGYGLYGSSAVPRAALVPAAVDLSLGRDHSCATDAEGAVWCWGHNPDGQVGNGTFDVFGVATPTPVVSLPADVVSIDTGGAHTCAASASEGVHCWGSNFVGALGNGTARLGSPFPVTLVPEPGARSLIAASVAVLGGLARSRRRRLRTRRQAA